jgi:hypothetical protein
LDSRTCHVGFVVDKMEFTEYTIGSKQDRTSCGDVEALLYAHTNTKTETKLRGHSPQATIPTERSPLVGEVSAKLRG